MNKFEKFILSLRSLGVLSVLLATLVITIPIKNLESKLNDVNNVIYLHKNSSLGARIFEASVVEQFTQRRIDLLERNMQRIVNNSDPSIRKELEERILNTTKSMIKRWELSDRGISEGHKESKLIVENLNLIIDNTNISFEEKFGRLEKLRINAINAFKKTSQRFQDDYKIFRYEENRLKKSKSILNIVFIWLQITGLLSLSISEILDKRQSFLNATENKKHNNGLEEDV